MRLRRCDRYLLRQVLGPFLLALAGLALFILLNLTLRLSELMVDRGIGLAKLLQLLIFWMPELIAWAIPMAALFAVFLGLGRLAHDREIMALESIGVSLRRILLPLLIASLGLCFLTFAVYNWAMPASKNAAQRTYREILFSQSAPRISANTFFTGSRDQYFYVRQYDADEGSVHDILIYDVSGRLFPQAESRITMITADSGTWANETWELASGRTYGFDRDGMLVYSGTFEELTIPVGHTADQMWAQSKSASEMGIRELIALIGQARASGLPTNESIVELHQRFALPLSALLFVLVGGTASLMFGAKSRSTGIIIALMIIGIHQGFHFWMQALGRRGAINPILAAWIPNLLFGAIGILLFIRVDRLASRDMWNRLRSRLPFLTAILMVGLMGPSSFGQDAPLHLECDDLFISADRSLVIEQGMVTAELAGSLLHADSLQMRQNDDSQWHLEATGNVSLDYGSLSLTGDTAAAQVLISETEASVKSLEASGFHAQSEFTNSSGEQHILYLHSESGQLIFDDAGEMSLIEMRNAEMTTCNCCGLPFQSQPYTVRADRLLFYPNRMIVAFGLSGKIRGVSVLWLPVYVQPLEDTLESPLFPAFGRSALRGWFLKWNVPFFLSESLYGSLLFDYYSKFNELGTGFVVRYAFAKQKGQVRVYSLPAQIGDSIFELSANHQLPTAGVWKGSGHINYSVVGDTTELDYGAQGQGSSNGWDVNVLASREVEQSNMDNEDETDDITKTTERFPEISMSRNPWTAGILFIQPRFEVGRYREQDEGDPSIEATRLSSGLDLSTQPLDWRNVSVSPRLILQASSYLGEQFRQSQGSLHASIGASLGSLSAVYNLRFVQGGSPFEFDAEVATHHIKVSFSRSGWATLNLSSGFDLAAGIADPIRADLGWEAWANWSLQANYQLDDATLTALELSGNWSSDVLQLTLAIPYQPVDARFGTIQLSANMPGEQLSLDAEAQLRNGDLTVRTNLEGTGTLGPVSATANLRLQNLSIDSLALSGEFASEQNWGAKAHWTYRGGPISLDQVSYGVFWDIGGCLRVGVDKEASNTWVYVSVLAFPEAVLRYAPGSAQIQAGS